MDRNSYPSLQSLAQTHARLAANARRVEEIIDSQLDGIERLFTAATTGDWEAIAQASRYLAKQDPAHIDVEIIRQARKLCDELAHARSKKCGPKHLATLIDACRNVRRKPLGG